MHTQSFQDIISTQPSGCGDCRPAPATREALLTEARVRPPQRHWKRRSSKLTSAPPSRAMRCSPRGMRMRPVSPRGDMHPHRACGRTGVRAARGGRRARPASGLPRGRAAAAAAAAAWPRPAAAPRTAPAHAPQHTSVGRLLAPHIRTRPMRVPDLAGPLSPRSRCLRFPAGKQRPRQRQQQLTKPFWTAACRPRARRCTGLGRMHALC